MGGGVAVTGLFVLNGLRRRVLGERPVVPSATAAAADRQDLPGDEVGRQINC
jgi:hypothetical protein